MSSVNRCISGALRSCWSKYITACQGSPETLVITIRRLFIFYVRREHFGVSGEVSPDKFMYLWVQIRCLLFRSEVFFRIADSKYMVVIVELLIIGSCVVLCRCKEVLPTRRLPQYYVNNDRNFWYRGGHFFMYSMIKVTTIAIMVRTTIRIS